MERREVNVGLNGIYSGTLAVGRGANDTRRRAAWDEFVAQTLTGVWADGRFGGFFTACNFKAATDLAWEVAT